MVYLFHHRTRIPTVNILKRAPQDIHGYYLLLFTKLFTGMPTAFVHSSLGHWVSLSFTPLPLYVTYPQYFKKSTTRFSWLLILFPQAYYAVHVIGQLMPGRTIVVTDGTNKLGVACLRVALEVTDNVITVVNSEAEMSQLRKLLPKVIKIRVSLILYFSKVRGYFTVIY